MKKEFDLENVISMKRPEYKKLFKKMAIWKKSRGVIIMVDYKLDGKKSSIAIPYKKKPLMLKELKKIKADKIHLLKKTALCSFQIEKNKEGKFQANIGIIKGGLGAELLEMKMKPVFGAIDLDIKVTGMAEDSANATENLNKSEGTKENVENKNNKPDNIIKSANQSFQYAKDFLIPTFKTGNLDYDDLFELDTHESNFSAFIKYFDDEKISDNAALIKLSEAIKKVMPQLDKIRHALDGSNAELQNDLVLNKLKTLFKDIEKKTKKLKKTVVKNIKKKKTTPRDLEVIDTILEIISEFEFEFDNAVVEIQEKVKKMLQNIQSKLKPQLKELYDKVLSTDPQHLSESAENKKIKLRYAEIDDNLKEMKLKIEKLIEEVKKEEKNAPKPEPLPEGDEFLKSLN